MASRRVQLFRQFAAAPDVLVAIFRAEAQVFGELAGARRPHPAIPTGGWVLERVASERLIDRLAKLQFCLLNSGRGTTPPGRGPFVDRASLHSRNVGGLAGRRRAVSKLNGFDPIRTTEEVHGRTRCRRRRVFDPARAARSPSAQGAAGSARRGRLHGGSGPSDLVLEWGSRADQRVFRARGGGPIQSRRFADAL